MRRGALFFLDIYIIKVKKNKMGAVTSALVTSSWVDDWVRAVIDMKREKRDEERVDVMPVMKP